MPFTQNNGLNSRFVYMKTGKFKDGRMIYQLLQDGYYYTMEMKDPIASEVKVPKGYQTDLASVPSLPFFPKPGGSLWDDAAVVHDKACDEVIEGTRTARNADAMFYYAMRECGCSLFTASVFWVAVRIGRIFARKGM